MTKSEKGEPDPPIHLNLTDGNALSFVQMNNHLSETLNEQRNTIRTLLYIVKDVSREAEHAARYTTTSPTNQLPSKAPSPNIIVFQCIQEAYN